MQGRHFTAPASSFSSSATCSKTKQMRAQEAAETLTGNNSRVSWNVCVGSDLRGCSAGKCNPPRQKWNCVSMWLHGATNVTLCLQAEWKNSASTAFSDTQKGRNCWSLRNKTDESGTVVSTNTRISTPPETMVWPGISFAGVLIPVWGGKRTSLANEGGQRHPSKLG